MNSYIEEKRLEGTVQAVYFSNPSNFYKVLLVEVEDTDTNFEGIEIVVVGNFGQIEEQESYEFFGTLTEHPKYGIQFKANRHVKQQPTSESAVISYLSGRKFKGIGEKTAEKIVDTLGVNVIDIVLSEPERLLEVAALNKKKRETLLEVLEEERGVDRIILTLNQYGIGNLLAYRIYSIYENKTLSVIQENPYQLVEDVKGIGFNRADQIAEELGVEADSPNRMQAALFHTLSNISLDRGDTYALARELLEKSLEILESSRQFIIDPENLANQLLSMAKEGVVIEDEGKFFLPSLYAAEWGIVQHIERLQSYDPQTTFENELKDSLKKIEKQLKITYGQSQKEAILQAVSSPVFILTGGPGTGKTTVLNGIVHLFAEVYDLPLDPHTYKDDDTFPFLLAAPTGRAAKRMKETTGLPASTIHRLLGLGADEDNSNNIESSEKLKGRLLIVDESSMVDTWLMNQLLQAVPRDMQVLLVGDKDQLPSVGPGQVLRDLIESDKIHQIELRDVYRQAENSSIIELAHSLKKDRLPTDFKETRKDRSFLACSTKQVRVVIEQVVEKAKLRGYTKDQIQVLAPMYKGPAGIDNLNKHLQEILNPNNDGSKKEVEFLEKIYRIGDKVLQLVNEPELGVFNGDMGEIVGIIPKKESELKQDELIIDFEGNEVSYARNEFTKITLAYCCSIHKAQGSEYEMVILPMVNSYYRMLKKDILYTAVTRASRFLIMLGEEQAFMRSINEQDPRRKTALCERLADEGSFQIEKTTIKKEKEPGSSENKNLGSNEKIDGHPILRVDNMYEISPMIGMEGITPYNV